MTGVGQVSPDHATAGEVDPTDWIGVTEAIEETVAAFPGMALAALLDADPAPAAEGEIAPLAHWLHFLPLHRQSDLAEDGHGKRGAFMPPVPLPRRMFAGAKVTFHGPIRVGDKARRVGRVTAVTPKAGRTGPLVFVKVLHEISGPAGLALTEEQDIVYRSAPQPSAPPPLSGGTPLGDWDWEATFMPDNAALFRYSALLFNAHRIHYDHPYATEHEAYPGLVVHGQLVATLLADMVRREAGPLSAFAFRSHAPFFADRPITLRGRRDGDAVALSAEDPDGLVGMTAEANLCRVDDHHRTA